MYSSSPILQILTSKILVHEKTSDNFTCFNTLQCCTNIVQQNSNYGSSHSEVFLRKGVLKICSKFTGEHPCQKVISIKLQKRCSENMQQTYRRAHMTKCDFNKVAWQLYWYQVSFTVTLLKNYKANPRRSFCRKRFLWYQTNILIGLKKT